MTTFVCIIAIDNFCLYYCKYQLLSAPLLSVCIFQVPLFCRYYWNWHSCYALLHMIFLHYVSQNIQIIWHLTTFVCTFYVWMQMMFPLCSIANLTGGILLGRGYSQRLSLQIKSYSQRLSLQIKSYSQRLVSANKKLFTETVSANKKLFTETVSTNKNLFAGTVSTTNCWYLWMWLGLNDISMLW